MYSDGVGPGILMTMSVCVFVCLFAQRGFFRLSAEGTKHIAYVLGSFGHFQMTVSSCPANDVNAVLITCNFGQGARLLSLFALVWDLTPHANSPLTYIICGLLSALLNPYVSSKFSQNSASVASSLAFIRAMISYF